MYLFLKSLVLKSKASYFTPNNILDLTLHMDNLTQTLVLNTQYAIDFYLFLAII